MLTHQKSWRLLQPGNGARSVVRICVAAMVVVLAVVIALGVNMYATQATPKAHAEEYVDYNVFPYGECTWYANERFHDIYGFYVPWRYGNANEWVNRAYAYGWRVSSVPSLHSIMVLQVGVQGATGFGHVAMVEQLGGDGSVLTSAMNGGAGPGFLMTDVFWPGPGVAFIRP